MIDNPAKLGDFLKHFSSIKGKKILVHGGGKEATALSTSMGIQTKMIEGRRVTDEETLKIVTMLYAGLINKRIVSLLQDFNCNAIGLSGADGNSIPASKRPSVPIDYGFVGDIDPAKINFEFINLLLENKYTPVFCAICRDENNGLLNCNADSIASALAEACSKSENTELIYCFEKPGVLSDIENESSVIPQITPHNFKKLKESGKISGGIIPKVTNALKALESGVEIVRICNGKNEGTIIKND